MNLSNRLQCMCGVLLVGVAVACGDSTPLGSIECIGERIRCGLTQKQLLDDDTPSMPGGERVSSTGLDVLTPISSRRAFEDAPTFGFSLIVDTDGELWTVTTGDAQIALVKLDRDGIALEEHSIEPPKGTRKPERFRSVFLGPAPVGTSRSRSVLTVTWSGCEDSEGSDDCQFTEVLAFDSFGETPRRWRLDNPNAVGVQANESGTWLLYGDFIDKRDNRGSLVWRQTGHLALRTHEWSWSARGVVRPDNQLSALISPTSLGSAQTLELWRLDSFGTIETRRHLTWFGEWPEYAVDAQGRDVIVGTSLDGDIWLMRVQSDGTAEGTAISREEYVDLRADGFALDPNGAVYVTSRAGGREARELREILCQLPAFGSARCFTLGELSASESSPTMLDDMVVTEPGVVYVRTGPDLRRYELPPL